MSNSNTGDVSYIFNGLADHQITMPVAGDYVVQVTHQMPLLRDGYTTALSTVIKLNTSTKLTSAAGASGARCIIQGVASGDVIHVVTSSSDASDQVLNAIQTQVQIFQGEV